MAEITHISQKGFEETDEGFDFVTCDCGTTIGPGPDKETVLDMAMEHAYRSGVSASGRRPSDGE